LFLIAVDFIEHDHQIARAIAIQITGIDQSCGRTVEAAFGSRGKRAL